MTAHLLASAQSSDLECFQRDLAWLLARAAPDLVARSGDKGRAVDAYVVEVFKDGAPSLLLRGMTGTTVQAHAWDGASYSAAEQVALQDIDPECLQVTHFAGLDELRFHGLRQFRRARRWRWPYWRLAVENGWQAATQWLFNKRSLQAQERVQVLRDVVDAVDDVTSAPGVDAFDLLSRRYGPRWAMHPAWKSHHARLQRLLVGLRETGELTVAAQRFLPTGLAYQRLEEIDAADRRHRENARTQFFLAVLATIGVVLAAAQAGVVKLPTLFDWSGQANESTCSPAAKPRPLGADTWRIARCDGELSGPAMSQGRDSTEPSASTMPHT